MQIQKITPNDLPALTDLWEASVRATHHFLTAADIVALRPFVAEALLSGLPVYKAVNTNNEAQGFIGVDGHRIEMLFISPHVRGQGIGKQLLAFATGTLSANEVDVNEQNDQAVAFYQHMGFETFARSELDGQGNPFPLLHMRLKAQA
ncbi:acetyltransferase [Enterobacillus tribolii]|uniref:Putative acetyltransferase n=1 Tax=Enterobacillus tribolii TaxID=1487935 RepID=A0A370QM67_9GAMM|nr:acetyltransferase [Enterobacillus tribolii]MBW7982297.1 acetyltransferase [Enterobacillus tribolii]RDK89467.1 putative acetyltransferase [Enterobacillus tribolii]